MRITSKASLIKYIRSQLGEPIITVEVGDDQIAQIIDDTVQMFTEYAYGTLEAAVILNLKGRREYPMPDTITNIIALSQGRTGNIANFSANYGDNYVPDVWTQQFFTDNFMGSIVPTIIGISNLQSTLNKVMGDELSYTFNPYRKVLTLHEDYHGSAVLHYQYEYIAHDDYDFIFNHEWVKQYSTQKTKFLWGQITGKYDASLVGGARINSSDFKSDASEQLDRLKEELLSKWSDPAPVLIG